MTWVGHIYMIVHTCTFDLTLIIPTVLWIFLHLCIHSFPAGFADQTSIPNIHVPKLCVHEQDNY